MDRGWVAAMLTADAKLDIGTGLAAAFGSDLHQLTDPIRVKGHERISGENALALIGLDETRGIVAAETEGGLCEIIGAETEESGILADLASQQGCPRQFDHGTDGIRQLDAAFLFTLAGDPVDDRLHQMELLRDADQRDHDLGFRRIAALPLH